MMEFYTGNTAPVEEQKICVKCGFCCDGTLFLHAHLDPGERDNIPERMREDSLVEDDKEYFRLPCHYFAGRCTIYNSKKAKVCSSYRCQLLKDFADGKITFKDAMETVCEAMNIRSSIDEEYRRVTGGKKEVVFRQILVEFGKMQKCVGEGNLLADDLEQLLTRCNIFEALLIKHLRSAEEFEKMIMK